MKKYLCVALLGVCVGLQGCENSSSGPVINRDANIALPGAGSNGAGGDQNLDTKKDKNVSNAEIQAAIGSGDHEADFKAAIKELVFYVHASNKRGDRNFIAQYKKAVKALDGLIPAKEFVKSFNNELQSDYKEAQGYFASLSDRAVAKKALEVILSVDEKMKKYKLKPAPNQVCKLMKSAKKPGENSVIYLRRLIDENVGYAQEKYDNIQKEGTSCFRLAAIDAYDAIEELSKKIIFKGEIKGELDRLKATIEIIKFNLKPVIGMSPVIIFGLQKIRNITSIK